MTLVDEGRLDLSDPIAKYLPEFKFMKVAVPRNSGAGGASPGNPGEEYELVQAYRPITVRATPKYPDSTSRTASGSRDSDSGVNPTRSQNST